MSIPETVMLDRCAGCAFRPGTEASQSTHTRAIRDLCVMVGSPFECHDTGAHHLCKGFVDAFVAKSGNGDYDRMPAWKKDMCHKLLDTMHDYREMAERGEMVPNSIVMDAVAEVLAEYAEGK